jgi:hypothetical protein
MSVLRSRQGAKVRRQNRQKTGMGSGPGERLSGAPSKSTQPASLIVREPPAILKPDTSNSWGRARLNRHDRYEARRWSESAARWTADGDTRVLDSPRPGRSFPPPLSMQESTAATTMGSGARTGATLARVPRQGDSGGAYQTTARLRTYTGRPLGDEEFLAMLEQHLGRILRRHKPGPKARRRRNPNQQNPRPKPQPRD